MSRKANPAEDSRPLEAQSAEAVGPFGTVAQACERFWGPVFEGLTRTTATAVEIADTVTSGVSIELDGTVSGIYQRATAWGHSLSRLRHVADFQAHSAGSRALFEAALDLEMLTQGLLKNEQMLAWERSARFLMAERAIESAARRNVADGPHERSSRAYLDNHRDAVVADRAAMWKKTHPMRWTGRSLFKDSDETPARGSFQPASVMREHYERLCWSTHGSALIIERALPASHYPGLVLLAAHLSAMMLAHCSRCCLEHFGKWSPEWATRLSADRMGTSLEEIERMAASAVPDSKPKTEGASA